jgi:hypothetical protein
MLSGLLVSCGATAVPTPAPGQRTNLTSTPISGSVPGPGAGATSPECAVPDESAALGPAVTPPSNPLTTIVKPSDGVFTFSVTSKGIYVLGSAGLSIYSLSGSLQRTFPLPSGLTSDGDNGVSEPIVSPAGDVYLSSYYGNLVAAYSPTGAPLWTVKGGDPLNIFALQSKTGAFELAVSLLKHAHGSIVYTASGHAAGTTALVEQSTGTVSRGLSGNLLYSNNGYVQTWTPTGSRMLSEFGSAHIDGHDQHTGGPYEFYYPGQAAQAADGTIYNANPLFTLTLTKPDGVLEGATTLGSALNMEPSGGMFIVGNELFVSDGPPFSYASAIAEVSTSTVQRFLDVPQAPLDTLGWGAGLSTAQDGNYFAPGRTPTVTAGFASWWAPLASHLELRYSVWNDATLTAEKVPEATTVKLPRSASALAKFDLTLPAADRRPGPYEVQAKLFDTAGSHPTLLGATCLPYTVGAPGDRLDLATLPPGVGSGGPQDPRGVVLNSELGLNGIRSLTGINWAQFLPKCNPSAPTASACGPSAMTFKGASSSPFKAAYLAARDHVTYWIQITGGDSTSQALVDDGYWQGDIEKLVSYYSHPPRGCKDCAAVRTWEPWNEANNTGWSDASSYVKEVLEPFYKGVKAADPSATVIGGSSIGEALPWWYALIAAGGLSYMSVAAIHPYPGNNDGWEEDGIPGQIQDLEKMLKSKPLWFTEVGWWNNGDYNYLHQADAVARALIWQKILHIPVWNYFFDEGTFGNYGISFSMIQTVNNGDDYVKPVALATMVATAQTTARPYLGLASTGIPQSYEARFGPARGGKTRLTALWSDELATPGVVVVKAPGGGTVPVTVTSEYGDTATAELTSGKPYTTTISGQVVYIAYPSGDTLSVGSTEAYGADLALASGGATATASSGNASAAIAGLAATVTEGQGWSSVAGDTAPSLTVELPKAATVNRVIVDTQSVGSTATSLRAYTVSAESPAGKWSVVGSVSAEYRDHEEQITFSPHLAQAVRINVSTINFGGYYGGGIPPFWSRTDAGVAFVHELEVFAGKDSPSKALGTEIAKLPSPG